MRVSPNSCAVSFDRDPVVKWEGFCRRIASGRSTAFRDGEIAKGRRASRGLMHLRDGRLSLVEIAPVFCEVCSRQSGLPA